MGFWKSAGNFFSSVINSPILSFISPILSIISIATMALSWFRKPDEPDFNVGEPTTEARVKGILANKTSG